MKLVLDARMIDSSGIGTYLQNLIPFLEKAYDLTLLGDVKKLRHFGYKGQVIPFKAPIYSLKEQVLFPFKIPKCDAFWSPHINAPWLPIRSKKRVLTVHDLFHIAHIENYSAVKRLYTRYTYKKALRGSQVTFSDSMFTETEIYKHFPKIQPHIQTIHCGIDQEAFYPSKCPKQDSKSLAKLGIKPPFFLIVGNIKPHKNILAALKAFHLAISKGKYLDHTLVIVGKKEGFITSEQGIYTFIEQHPELKKRTLFTGFIELNKLRALYSLCALFIFPSLYEGFGLPPLEALACGARVISSDRASMPEVLKDYVTYFDPTSAEDLLKAIDKELSIKRSKLHASEHVNAYTWAKASEACQKALAELKS